jgi:hypothetical protein
MVLKTHASVMLVAMDAAGQEKLHSLSELLRTEALD